MKTPSLEFEPLEQAEAEQLQETINRAARQKEALVIDPAEDGITDSRASELISPNESTNGLVRYQRHY